MQRLALLALRANRKVQIDRHPLARADGGWYPGKHFDPTDVLTDPKNWLVWKQFIIFFSSILFLPVGVFLGSEYIMRIHWGWHVNKSTTIAAVASMLVLQALMLTYARLAAIENTDEDDEETTKLVERHASSAETDGVASTTASAPGRTAEEIETLDDNKEVTPGCESAAAGTESAAAEPDADKPAAEKAAAAAEVAEAEMSAEDLKPIESSESPIICDGNVCMRGESELRGRFAGRSKNERL